MRVVHSYISCLLCLMICIKGPHWVIELYCLGLWKYTLWLCSSEITWEHVSQSISLLLCNTWPYRRRHGIYKIWYWESWNISLTEKEKLKASAFLLTIFCFISTNGHKVKNSDVSFVLWQEFWHCKIPETISGNLMFPWTTLWELLL